MALAWPLLQPSGLGVCAGYPVVQNLPESTVLHFCSSQPAGLTKGFRAPAIGWLSLLADVTLCPSSLTHQSASPHPSSSFISSTRPTRASSRSLISRPRPPSRLC
eukprot:13225724-Alexandrium_andersonii.AAC.1